MGKYENYVGLYSIALVVLLMHNFSIPAFADYQEPVYDVARTNGLVYGIGIVSDGNDPSKTWTMNLLLDAYAPVGNNAPDKPCLIVIHGGGFKGGSRSTTRFVDISNYFASRGFVCFSIDYRLKKDYPPTQGHDVPINPSDLLQDKAAYAAFVDTKAAIRWIRAHREDYGIANDRFAAIGGSAGSFCTLTAAITDNDDYAADFPGDPTLPENSPGVSTRIQVCIDNWGGANHVANEFDSNDPPIMIVHGTEDTTVPFILAEQVRDKCVEFGIPYAFYPIEGAGHGPWNAVIDSKTLNELWLEFIIQHLDLGPSPSNPQRWPSYK